MDNQSDFRYAEIACEGKVQFDSITIAKKAAKRKKGRHAYKCRDCRKWYVGGVKTHRMWRDG